MHKNLSSKFDRFLAVHGVNFYAPIFCLSATFVRPLFAFVLCFLQTQIISHFVTDAIFRCDFYSAVVV